MRWPSSARKVLTGRLSRCRIDGRSAPDHTRLVCLSDRSDWAPAGQGIRSRPIRAVASESNRRPRPAGRDPLTSRLADFIRSGPPRGKRYPSFQQLSTRMIRPCPVEAANPISGKSTSSRPTSESAPTSAHTMGAWNEEPRIPGSSAYSGADDEPTARLPRPLTTHMTRKRVGHPARPPQATQATQATQFHEIRPLRSCCSIDLGEREFEVVDSVG